jgi:branched-chain amino acid transport system permease protein
MTSIVFAILFGVLLFLDRVIGSRFGLVLQGSRQNERRLEAVGYSTFRYKLVAFVIAGVLLAACQQFVSPANLAWTRSASLSSCWCWVRRPGAEHKLQDDIEGRSEQRPEQQIAFGPVFIFFVLFVRGGIAALFEGPFWRRGSHG